MKKPVLKLTPGATIKTIELPETLAEWYEHLDCDIFTVTYRIIGGKEYCIFADDEGLLKSDAQACMVFQYEGSIDMQRMNGVLVGNLIIVNAETDDEGNTLPLSLQDIVAINESLTVGNHIMTQAKAWVIKR